MVREILPARTTLVVSCWFSIPHLSAEESPVLKREYLDERALRACRHDLRQLAWTFTKTNQFRCVAIPESGWNRCGNSSRSGPPTKALCILQYLAIQRATPATRTQGNRSWDDLAGFARTFQHHRDQPAPRFRPCSVWRSPYVVFSDGPYVRQAFPPVVPVHFDQENSATRHQMFVHSACENVPEKCQRPRRLGHISQNKLLSWFRGIPGGPCHGGGQRIPFCNMGFGNHAPAKRASSPRFLIRTICNAFPECSRARPLRGRRSADLVGLGSYSPAARNLQKGAQQVVAKHEEFSNAPGCALRIARHRRVYTPRRFEHAFGEKKSP